MYKDLGLAMDAIEKTKSNINYGKQTFEKYKKSVKMGKGHLIFQTLSMNNLN